MKEGQAVKNGKVYGCHCDLGMGEEPDGCVLDMGDPAACIYTTMPSGRKRQSKWTCGFWKPFKSVLEDGKP